MCRSRRWCGSGSLTSRLEARDEWYQKMMGRLSARLERESAFAWGYLDLSGQNDLTVV